MKFDHLLASVRNHEKEEPSLYMAVCMVETLFEDIEEAAGCEIRACAVGDDRLPVRLIWLCRTVEDIFRERMLVCRSIRQSKEKDWQVIVRSSAARPQ